MQAQIEATETRQMNIEAKNKLLHSSVTSVIDQVSSLPPPNIPHIILHRISPTLSTKTSLVIFGNWVPGYLWIGGSRMHYFDLWICESEMYFLTYGLSDPECIF